jgi:hypothetical protein
MNTSPQPPVPLLFAADRYKDCNGVVSDGCETSIKDDPLNCGACNAAASPFANAAPACVNGASALGTCNPGRVCDAGPIYSLLLCNTNSTVPLSTADSITQTSQTCMLIFWYLLRVESGC